MVRPLESLHDAKDAQIESVQERQRELQKARKQEILQMVEFRHTRKARSAQERLHKELQMQWPLRVGVGWFQFR